MRAQASGVVLDGIDRSLPPEPACDEDLCQRQASGQAMPLRLPRDLNDALAALQANTVLRDSVGAAFCEQFLVLKRAEWDTCAQQVSDWELQRYADAQ